MRRRAELASAGADDDTVAAWFKRHPPTSGFGKVRAAELALNRGEVEAGTAALRKAWIEGDFGPFDERGLLARHGVRLRPEDHQARLDRLLWDGQTDAAKRMLPLVSADYRALAEARLAARRRFRHRREAGRQAPRSSCATTPGWSSSRRASSAKRTRSTPRPNCCSGSARSAHPAAYWEERLVLARRLMTSGNAATAYRLAAQDLPGDDDEYTEAQFLAGYIALRFRNEPGTAFDHFARIIARATSPDVKGRAAYWAGRAAEATRATPIWRRNGTRSGPNTARRSTASSRRMSSATTRRRSRCRNRGRPTPSRPGSRRRRWFAPPGCSSPPATAPARMNFLMAMADQAKTPIDFAMLAALAESHGRVDLAIAVARRAIEAGMPLMVHGYPVTTVPGAGGTAERPLILAIVRQESAFSHRRP